MIPPSAVEEFKASLRGPLLRPGEAGYDEARKVWNGSIDKRPALIARRVGVSDAIRCVNFARANKVLVAVRGGGHNIGGNAVCDDGLVIDLSRMKSLRVDPTQHSGGTVSGKVLALSQKGNAMELAGNSWRPRTQGFFSWSAKNDRRPRMRLGTQPQARQGNRIANGPRPRISGAGLVCSSLASSCSLRALCPLH